MKPELKPLLTVFIVISLFIRTSDVMATNQTIKTKTFHLIYVETSETRNKIETANKVVELIKQIEHQKDSFVVFISNRNSTELLKDPSQANYISEIINKQNIATPIAKEDRTKLLQYFDQFDIIHQTPDDKVALKYGNLKLHLFQSPTFTRLFSDQFIYRLLKIKNISDFENNNQRVELIFYLDKSAHRFEESKNYQSQITGYDKSYAHTFIVY